MRKKYENRPNVGKTQTKSCALQTVIYCSKKYTMYHCFENTEALVDFQKKNPKFKILLQGKDRFEVEIGSVDIDSETINRKAIQKQLVDDWKESRYLKVKYHNEYWKLTTPIRATLFNEWKCTLPNEKVIIENSLGGRQTVSLSDLEL